MTDPPEAAAPDGVTGPRESAARDGVADFPEAPAPAVARIAGAAALITVLTVVARIAGFGRTFVFLRTVGDDGLANIYNAANTIPNIVFELVAGGALASLVVPLLAGAVAAGQRDRVDAVASALLTWVLALLIPLAIVVALAAGPIAGLLPGVAPDHQEVAARMLRVFAPQLPLYGVGIVLTGVLQAHHRFAWPVIAPLLSSVTVMGAYLSYAAIDGARSDFAHLSHAGELTLSVGTTLGVVVLALCLVVPLRRLKVRLRPTFRFPGGEGRQAVRLGWAGAVTVGAQQVMVAVVIALAVGGPLTRYNAAQTVFLLPWAVLAVPLATAAYPSLAPAVTNGPTPVRWPAPRGRWCCWRASAVPRWPRSRRPRPTSWAPGVRRPVSSASRPACSATHSSPCCPGPCTPAARRSPRPPPPRPDGASPRCPRSC